MSTGMRDHGSQLGGAVRRMMGEEIANEVLRADLRQIVRIHSVMFEKFLNDNGEMASDLAALFEDAGMTYLQIAERISSKNPALRRGY